MQEQQSMPMPKHLNEPLVFFLGGMFAGVVAGPQLIAVGKDMIRARSNELAAMAIERFVTALKGATHD